MARGSFDTNIAPQRNQFLTDGPGKTAGSDHRKAFGWLEENPAAIANQLVHASVERPGVIETLPDPGRHGEGVQPNPKPAEGEGSAIGLGCVRR